MRQRYFLIEPKYDDPDTFCHFLVGSDRVRASIQIYADMWLLGEVVKALEADKLDQEWPELPSYEQGAEAFHFQLTVLPHDGGKRILRFRVFQEMLDDGVPFRADIRFELTLDEAAEIASDLKAWCANPTYVFNWKGN